jgi:hypothetical protein
MHRRLPKRLAPVLAALLILTPGQAPAQRYGGYGGWHGGGGYYGAYGYRGYYPAYGYGGYYRSYYGYPGYYGYRGYYGHYSGYGPWVAAGILGVMLGAAVAQPYVYAPPPPPVIVYAPPPPPHPAMQQCSDGSTIPAGSYCPAPVAPPPAAIPRPSPERG